MASSDLVAQCRRSAHFWRGWLERGDSSDAEASRVFKDTVLVAWLESPLQHYKKGEAASGSSSSPVLSEKAKSLAKKASDALKVNEESSENLMRLFADERLGSYCVLHHQGSVFDLLDLSDEEKVLGELSSLYHLEQCETLEIVKCVLRIASDRSHPYRTLCKGLAEEFAKCSFHKALWSLYLEVSRRPIPLEPVPHSDVLSLVREVLDLQLRILECFVLMYQEHLNNEEFRERFFDKVSLFYRQHFLGYFYDAAGSRDAPHPWLLEVAQICIQAQCVGDLCLTLSLAGLKPESLRECHTDDILGLSARKQHHLFGDQPFAKRLHDFFRVNWVDKCERIVGHRATPSGVGTHLAHMASLMLLGWAAAITTATTLRDMSVFSLDKIVNSVVFRSPNLVEDAVASILRRGYLMQHTPSCEHGAVRAVLRSFVATVASSFRLDKATPGILNAMGRLMHASHIGEPAMSEKFYKAEYCHRQGSYWVVQNYFQTFPLSLVELLSLVGGLGATYEKGDASRDASSYTLFRKPVESVLLPYHPSDIVIAAGFDACGADETPVVLQESFYLEELALRSLGLVLPEWHVSQSIVVRSGTKGVLQDPASEEGRSFVASGRGKKVRWKLPAPGVSIWRLALASWDAALESLGFTQPSAICSTGVDSPAAKMLLAVVRCVSELLVSRPDALLELSTGLPEDDCQNRMAPYDGLLARLLASFHACASLGGPGSAMLPLILRALGASARAQQKNVAIPPYVVLLNLLNGGSYHRFRHGDTKALIEVLTTCLDREREGGIYPVTLAALVFFEDFLRSCSAELVVLPAHAHIGVALLDGSGKGIFNGHILSSEKDFRGIDTVGMLIDFTFGLCFARCSFWSCRKTSDRHQLVLACLRIASALLPCMECFNWSTSFGGDTWEGAQHTGAQSSHLADALQRLRTLQYRIQRSWSESSFVHTLLHWICCDVAFGNIGGDASKHSLGLRVPAQEENFQSSFVVPQPEDMYDIMEPVSGVKVIIAALECLHGLLALVLRPGGIAPDFSSLARHLLALSIDREPLGTQPANSVFGSTSTTLVPQRADLVQSLYGHCFAVDPIVAGWSARVMTALCVLWKHRELQSSPATGSVEFANTLSEPQLLAFLSVPPRPVDSVGFGDTGNNSKPIFLFKDLARKLFDVMKDCKDVSLQCAFADLVRVLLKTQPGLFLGDELYVKAVSAAARALEDVIGKTCAMTASMVQEKEDEDENRANADGLSHLLSVLLGLLDNLASAMNDAMFVTCFSSKGLEGSGSKYSTTWHLLNALVSKVLLPWAGGEGFLPPSAGGVSARLTPSCMIVVAAVFRLAGRGCALADNVLSDSQAAHDALIELVVVLLGTSGSELWLHSGQSAAALARSHDEDFSVMAHPYGAFGDSALKGAQWNILQDSRASMDRFGAILARYELSETQFGASTVCTQSTGAATESSSDVGFVSGNNNNTRTGALLQAYGGRCSIPATFRWWSDICELACGTAVDIASPVQLWLPIWQPPPLTEVGTHSLNVGSWSWDSHFTGVPCSVQGVAVRWAAAQLVALGKGAPDMLEELRGLVSECSSIPIIHAGMFARVLAIDSFNDFVLAAAGQAHLKKGGAFGTRVSSLVTPLTLNLAHQLYGALQHLDLLSDYSAFFARFVRLVTNLLALPLHVSAIMSPSEVLTPFSAMGKLDDCASNIRRILDRETPMGLALVRQLGAALHICSSRIHSCEDLPPRTPALISGGTFYKGHADVVLALVSLLLLLVPALRPKPGSVVSRTSFEATTLLSDLLQVIAALVDCLQEAENREAIDIADASRNKPVLPTSVRFVGEEVQAAAGPAGGRTARPGIASPESLNGVVLLQSSEDALARTAATTQNRALDHLLRSGTSALLLRLAERAVTALRERGESCNDKQHSVSFSAKISGVLRGTLLPRLLKWGFLQAQSQVNLGSRAIGERPESTAVIWDRAVEAAWACRLESVLTVLSAIAQSAPGAVMLAEQRIFALLAASQLFQYAVLPDASGQFPAAYAWPRNFQRQRVGVAAPWRRPLHESWCQALLLVATLLSSAPELLSEATVFLQRFAPRFRYLFRSGVQSGHMAMLEEATAASRILSLMAHRCGLAETLLADAATQSLIFIVRTCLSDVSSPLEVFAPVSAAERLSGRLETESEAVAKVPSVFQQRTQFLALSFSQNVLLALLRVVSTSVWRSNAAAWLSSSPWTSSATANAPKGWSTMPSVLGLSANSNGSLGVGNSTEQAGPQRLWAAVMDIALEGAQRFVGILEALKKDDTFPILSVSTSAASVIPLSLAIAPFGEESCGIGASSPLALPFSPLHRPQTPGDSLAASGFGTKRKNEKRSPMRYKCMALRPDSWVGGQTNCGVIPEYATYEDLRKLCSTNLEMACTLLCHYCQATLSSTRDRSAPIVSVSNGVMSFLHELRKSSLYCKECDPDCDPGMRAQAESMEGSDKRPTFKSDHWLVKLDTALRASQQLGVDGVMQSLAQGGFESGSGEEVESPFFPFGLS